MTSLKATAWNARPAHWITMCIEFTERRRGLSQLEGSEQQSGDKTDEQSIGSMGFTRQAVFGCCRGINPSQIKHGYFYNMTACTYSVWTS